MYTVTSSGVAVSGAPSAILHDELLTATPELVTVYIYVDGSRDWSTLYDDGPFFLSVTRNDDCPDPTTWYTGPIHTVIEPGINDLAVPINGSNFPGVTPNTQSGSIGTVPAVLLPGDTRTAGDSFYDGDTDIDTDPYAWKGYDELWQLDILADGVDFSTTLCDYGGWVDLSYDTALDSAVGYTNSTEVTGTDTIWTNPILIDSETVPGSCSQLSGNVQSVAGACFVGGGDQQNCNVVCAGRGGYCDTEYTDSAMFVAATDPVLCESLVDALNWNVPWTAPSAIGAPGVGCGLINWNSATQDLNVPPTCAATPPSNNFRRVCPCVPPPGIDTDTYMGTDSEVVITDTAWETDSYVDTWTEQLSQPFNPMLALFNCWGDRIDWNDDGGDCSGEVPNINPTSAVVQNDGPYYLLVDGRFETGVTGTLEGHEYDLSVYYPGPIPTVPCDPTDTENTTQEYSINLSASDYTLNTQFEYYPSDCIAAAATGWTATYMRINAGDIVPIGTVAQCCDCGGNPTQCAALGCPNVSCFPLTFHYDVWYEDSSTGEICINSGQALQYDRHGNTVDHNVPTPATFGSCDNMIRLGVAYTPPSHLTPTDYAWCQTHCPYTNTIYMRQRSTP